jgi:hypothetical protein
MPRRGACEIWSIYQLASVFCLFTPQHVHPPSCIIPRRDLRRNGKRRWVAIGLTSRAKYFYSEIYTYNSGTSAFETKWTPTWNSIKSGIGIIEKMCHLSVVLLLVKGRMICKLGLRIWKSVTVRYSVSLGLFKVKAAVFRVPDWAWRN